MHNEFLKTTAALAELEEILAHTEKVMEHKREQLKQRQSNNDQRISVASKKNDKLKNIISDTAENVQEIIDCLDKVLGENGTSNHQN